MNKNVILLLVVTVALLFANGCTSRIIGEALGHVHGSYRPVKPLAAAPEAKTLGEYTMFKLGRFVDDTGGHLPDGFGAQLKLAFDEQIAAKELPNYAGKALIIKGRVLYYEKAGMFGQIFGPLEEVVARIELIDEASGESLGTANVVGRTKATRVQGPETKAKGLAKGIVKWLSDHYPETDEG